MNSRGHLSSETIDLLLMSALAAGESNEAKAHLDQCETCRLRWRDLNQDKERFEQFVFPRTHEKVTSRVIKPTFFEWLKLRGPKTYVPMLAGAAALLVAVTVTLRVSDEYVGIKGEAGLSFEVVAQRSSAAQFAVKAGTVLKAKDRIRFVVNGGTEKYVLIGSRDGAGAFSVYYPYLGVESAALGVKGPTELPGSIELDEIAGKEQLIAVFSSAPVQAETVKRALEHNAQSPALDGAKVLSLEFVKER